MRPLSYRLNGRTRTAARTVRRGAALGLAAAAIVPATAVAAHPTSSLPAGPAPAPTAPQSAGPAQLGAFSEPFEEPTIDGRRTDEKCLEGEDDENSRSFRCKPSAGSVNVLPDGDVFYWDALEGTENVEASIVAEYGQVSGNDQSRRLDLNDGEPTWSEPEPVDGGANPDGYDNAPLFPPPFSETSAHNDGALFCSDNNLLPGGLVIAAGGTGYYDDPGADVGDRRLGVAELEGLRNTRIYDSESNSWFQADPMEFGRWYPTMVSLPDGDQFTASGVKKLIKPVYPDEPERSGRNVVESETFDISTGDWSYNGEAADRSLPLFPRMHMLPNGHVFYNAGGQSFNPAGQAYDEASWNVAASYDPEAGTWNELGIPGADAQNALEDGNLQDSGDPVGDAANLGIPGGGEAATIPGFRGSTFSVMQPLRPDSNGDYTEASFLVAGGVVNPPSPGSYFATSDSRLTTVDTSGGEERMSTEPTGDMTRPRWYSSGVLLPTGETIAFSGADRDEVVAPGTEIPIKEAEIFDPETREWSPVAEGHQPRTYHNSAALLPDGRVLIGGHAPISTLYANNTTLAPGLTAPNNGRDPSFEIYSPPYMFRGDRPEIRRAPERVDYGERLRVRTDTKAEEIESVTLVRNHSQTHVIDGDQRTVELEVLSSRGKRLTLAAPPDGAVAPPGPYMLFVNKRSDEGPIPSESAQVELGAVEYDR